MSEEKPILENGHPNENSSVTTVVASSTLKKQPDEETPKLNIDKVFVLNEKCFVKTPKPPLEGIIEIQNSNGFVIKKENTDKKINDANSKLIEIKSDDRPCIEIGEDKNEKNAKGDTEEDIQALKELLTSLTSPKAEEEPEKTVANDLTSLTSSKAEEPEKTVANDEQVAKSKDKDKEAEEKKEATEDPTSASPKKPKKQRKFLYRLKSKNGKILSYTSSVPITLKKPLISLKKMTKQEAEAIALKPEVIEIANSLKSEDLEKVLEPKSTVRKRGRPRLYPKLATSQTVRSSKPGPRSKKREMAEAAESLDLSSGIQTRKRQLKFLPDGRLLKNKKKRDDSSSSDTSFSDDDEMDLDSDSDYKASSSDSKPETPKKFALRKSSSSPSENKKVKVISPEKGKEQVKVKELVKKVELVKEVKEVVKSIPKEPIKLLATKELKPPPTIVDIKKTINASDIRKSTGAERKTAAIDPAQLLSSLTGVAISLSQLNIVRFKPKNLQGKLTPGTPITKKIITDSKNSFNKVHEMIKNAKSAPSPSSTFLRAVTTPGFTYSPNVASKSSTSFKPMVPKLVPIVPKTPNVQKTSPIRSKEDLLRTTLSKFDSFTNTKIVKTKAGPKKFLEEKLANDPASPKTVYDLMNEIFDTMPSWNLHVIPETKSFCIAQVSRSRMGIPVLKKSIELNSDFFAKVYVHQLHCKRYDGVYDTESKIKKLIVDVDSLAA